MDKHIKINVSKLKFAIEEIVEFIASLFFWLILIGLVSFFGVAVMEEKLKAIEMTEKKLKELFQEMDGQIEVIERGLEK